MRRTSFKKLGYWLSALAIALGTVAFYPEQSTYAESVGNLNELSGALTTRSIELSGDISIEAPDGDSIVTLDDGEQLTIDLAGNSLSYDGKGGNKPDLFNLSGAVLNITDSDGRGTLNVSNGGNAVYVYGDGQVNVIGGKFVTDSGSTIFVTNDGVVNIKGGDFTGCSGNFVGDADDGTVILSGGVYSSNPLEQGGVVLASGKALYHVDDLYYVTAKSEFTAYNETNNYFLPGASGNLYTFSAGEKKFTDVISGTSIDNTVTSNITAEAYPMLSFDAATGKVTVSVNAQAGSAYKDVEFKDLSNTTVKRTVRVYSLDSVGNLEIGVDQELDLSSALTVRGMPEAGIRYKVESDSATISGKTFKATATGVYTVTYTINDVNYTSGTFEVKVLPKTDSHYVWKNLAEGNMYEVDGDAAYDTVTDWNTDYVANITNDTNTAKTTIELKEDALYYGKTTYKLEGVKQNLYLRTYRVPTDLYVTVGSAVNIASPEEVRLPENDGNNKFLQSVVVSNRHGNVTVEPTVGDDGKLATTYYVAESAGDDVVTWNLPSGKKATTNIHVYEEKNSDLGEYYWSISDGAYDVVNDIYGSSRGDTEITVEIDNNIDEVSDDGKVTFKTTGEKKITFTEKLGDEVINEGIEATVYVTGLVPEAINLVAGVEKEVDITPAYGTITSKTASTGVNVADGYVFSAENEGTYTVSFTVAEEALDEDGEKTTIDRTYEYEVVVSPADEPSVDEPVDEPTEPEDPSEEPSGPTTDPEEPSEEPGESTDPTEPETPATDGPSESETPTDEPGTDEPTSEEKAPVILRDAGFTIGSYLENAREAGSPEEYEKVLRDFEACFGSKEAYEKVQAALHDGGTISTEVEVTPLAAEDVDEEAKKAIENELDLTFLGNVSYYDIDVIVKVNDEVVGTMTDLAYETMIAVSAESAADGYAREYIVVRYHDGKAEIIESLYDEENELLVFASDKFSTYAVAYRDTKLSATNFTPNTGVNTVENAGSASANITVATAVAVAVIGLAGAAVFAKRR